MISVAGSAFYCTRARFGSAATSMLNMDEN
jgi:hypothetical protein